VLPDDRMRVILLMFIYMSVVRLNVMVPNFVFQTSKAKKLGYFTHHDHGNQKVK
jgi:hypothetical protein